MSEEEKKAIEILTTYKNQILERKPFTYSFIDMQWAINTILYLYKQEKEKNKELENADLTTVYLDGVYDGEKKWKDKIRAKMQEWDIPMKWKDNDDWAYAVKIFKELLED